MDPESVVENIQDSAAHEAALEVAADVNANTAAVGAEVAAVGEVLEDHAELSEERHEEILEGELWIRNQLVLLLTNTQTILTTLGAMQVMIAEIRVTNESTVLPPLIPEPEEIPVVVPVVAVVPPVPETVPEAPPKRKRRVI
jgi:hypothetical protein